MDYEGFNSANVALLDGVTGQVKTGNDGLSDSGVFSINAGSSMGVINASVSGLAPQTQNIAGSNEIVGVSGAGTGAITCTLGINDLPTDVEYKLIGAKRSGSGAWHLDSDTRSPYAALELVTEGRDPETKKTDYAHIGFPKGQFYMQPQNLRTNNGTGSINRATDSLQFKAINRSNDHQVIQFGYQTDSNFNLSAFRNDIFPGASLADSNNPIDPTSANGVNPNAGQPVNFNDSNK